MLGFIFLHESLGPLQIAGVALIVVAALSLSMNPGAFLRVFKLRLAVLMLGATFALALSTVVFKLFALEDSFWTTTFWTFVGEAIFGLGILAVPAYRKSFISLFKNLARRDDRGQCR